MTESKPLTEREEILLLKGRVDWLERDLKQVKDELGIYKASTLSLNDKVKSVEGKIDQLLNAVVGDDLGNDGIITRLKGLEHFHDWFEKKKWWTLGAFAVITTAIGFIAYIIEKVSGALR